MNELDAAFRAHSPRFNPRDTPLHSIVIHVAILVFWIALTALAIRGTGLLAWSVGVAYVGYDTLLTLFVASRTLPLLMRPQNMTEDLSPTRLSLGIVIAAHNEARVLEATIDALLSQDDPPDLIVVADDGSVDDSATVLEQRYGLAAPAFGVLSDGGSQAPSVRWLRLPHGGKARALNAALRVVTTEIVVTVDADTILDRNAVGTIRAAFAADPDLVVGGGVLTPVCDAAVSGRAFEFFQTFEYIRNFMARYAWSRIDSLLLISGAFAAFRRDAVTTVGGFDPACLTEDYELIHRLHRHAADRGLPWRIRIVGRARARTSAPARVGAFLRQRRRWFAGFLQTQYWNRDMTGTARYGALGLVMLPVKAVDTLQPIYGLTAILLLPIFLVTGRAATVVPAAGFMLAKIVFDLCFYVLSIVLYRRWTGDTRRGGFGAAIIAACIEPFSFQILRHAGATWGWVAALTRDHAWGARR